MPLKLQSCNEGVQSAAMFIFKYLQSNLNDVHVQGDDFKSVYTLSRWATVASQQQF